MQAVSQISRADRKRSQSAERMARYRARKAEGGMVTVTVLVPAHAAPDIIVMGDKLRANPDLQVGPMICRSNGRFVSLQRG